MYFFGRSIITRVTFYIESRWLLIRLYYNFDERRLEITIFLLLIFLFWGKFTLFFLCCLIVESENYTFLYCLTIVKLIVIFDVRYYNNIGINAIFVRVFLRII